MYYEKFFPFYAAYTNPFLYDNEKMQENEFSKMKSYYPEMAGLIQDEVEQECELLDYEGSRLYDEYPDRLMLKEMAGSIKERIAPDIQMTGSGNHFLDELIEVLLYQEISRRRCRRHRCRRYYL